MDVAFHPLFSFHQSPVVHLITLVAKSKIPPPLPYLVGVIYGRPLKLNGSEILSRFVAFFLRNPGLLHYHGSNVHYECRGAPVKLQLLSTYCNCKILIAKETALTLHLPRFANLH